MTEWNEIVVDGITPAQLARDFAARQRTLCTLDPYEKAKLIHRRMPDIADDICRKAEQLYSGYMVLPGSPEPQYVGSPPEWTANPKGHKEYLFHLNRMEHWSQMLKAYTLGGDECYLFRVRDELADWIDRCPRPPLKTSEGEFDLEMYGAHHPWRALECGIRPYRTWSFVLEILASAKLLNEELMEKVVVSLYRHGEVLYNISPLLWPRADHNHYLMENLGLLYISCEFPELRTAALWKQHALAQLCRCMENQVDEQGAQIEGCPSYHGGCVFWFAMVMVFARRYGLELPQSYIERFNGMFRYSLYVTRPDGRCAPWGDSSTTPIVATCAISSFLGNGNAEALRMARHFVSYDELKQLAAEHLWRFSDLEGFLEAMEAASESPMRPQLPAVLFDPTLDHLYMRTGWDRQAVSITFACRTPVQNLHAHIDPCGFDLSACGSPLVVDPGRYSYAEGEARRNFKSSAWHNTLTVNGRDAWEYISSWQYGPQRPGGITAYGDTPQLKWGIAKHSNYSPAMHRRGIAICHDSFVLVMDRVDGLDIGDTVQLHYHLDNPMEQVAIGEGCVATDSSGANAVIAVSCGSAELRHAYVSDTNDSRRDSCIAVWTVPATDRIMVAATLILPVPQGADKLLPHGLCANPEGDGLAVSFWIGEKRYEYRMSGESIEEHGSDERGGKR